MLGYRQLQLVELPLDVRVSPVQRRHVQKQLIDGAVHLHKTAISETDPDVVG